MKNAEPPGPLEVLFVDDDASLLAAVKRVLRPLREEWNVHFAENTQQALDILGDTPCDVVISDIRMPGRSGVDLLCDIAARWPNTIRIALSGNADHGMAFKSVRSTHQFLSKPCEMESLVQAVRRASRLQLAVRDPDLIRLVGSLERLPSLPTVYRELIAALDNPDCPIEEVGEIVGRDIAIAASLLKLVNSAYFALPRTIGTPTEAARLLGVDTIKTLTLGIGVFQQFEGRTGESFDIGRFSTHCLSAASVSRRIAKELGLDRAGADTACMAGMFHDVGELILAANMADRFDLALKTAARESVALWRVERDEFKTTHMDLGAYLLALWGMPSQVVEAAAFHHCPSFAGVPRSPDALTVAHIADVAVARGGAGTDTHLGSELDMEYLTQLKIAPQAVQLVAEYAKEHAS